MLWGQGTAGVGFRSETTVVVRNFVRVPLPESPVQITPKNRGMCRRRTLPRTKPRSLDDLVSGVCRPGVTGYPGRPVTGTDGLHGRMSVGGGVFRGPSQTSLCR